MTAPSAGDPGPVLASVSRALDACGIPYMVAGSFASSYHGSPRSTHDLDLVIDPSPAQLEAFLALLSPIDTYFDLPSAREALRRRDQFNVIDLATGWKVDLIIRKDRAFSREEMSRRSLAKIFDVDVKVATAEDTILAKLEWSKLTRSERQLEDIRGILTVHADSMDRAYLDRWARALGVTEAWERVQKQEDA